MGEGMGEGLGYRGGVWAGAAAAREKQGKGRRGARGASEGRAACGRGPRLGHNARAGGLLFWWESGGLPLCRTAREQTDGRGRREGMQNDPGMVGFSTMRYGPHQQPTQPTQPTVVPRKPFNPAL